MSSPRRKGSEAAYGAHRLRDAALASAASVLFLPSRADRSHGPVVAVMSGAEDPSLAVAWGIADQAKERLLVVGTGGEAAIQIPPGATVHDIVAALGDTRERLIVLCATDRRTGRTRRRAGRARPGGRTGLMVAATKMACSRRADQRGRKAVATCRLGSFLTNPFVLARAAPGNLSRLTDNAISGHPEIALLFTA